MSSKNQGTTPISHRTCPFWCDFVPTNLIRFSPSPSSPFAGFLSLTPSVFALLAAFAPSKTSSSSSASNSLDLAENEPQISLEEAEAYLTENKLKKDSNGKWDAYASIQAAQDGRVDVLKWILKLGVLDTTTLAMRTRSGPEVTRSAHGLNSVLVAAREGRLEVLKWFRSLHLLDTNVTDNNSSNNNVARYAAVHGYLEILQWMQECNILDLKSENRDGYTCAHLAARHGNLDILQWLKASNLLDWDARNKDDMTLADLLSSEGKELLL